MFLFRYSLIEKTVRERERRHPPRERIQIGKHMAKQRLFKHTYSEIEPLATVLVILR